MILSQKGSPLQELPECVGSVDDRPLSDDEDREDHSLLVLVGVGLDRQERALYVDLMETVGLRLLDTLAEPDPEIIIVVFPRIVLLAERRASVGIGAFLALERVPVDRADSGDDVPRVFRSLGAFSLFLCHSYFLPLAKNILISLTMQTIIPPTVMAHRIPTIRLMMSHHISISVTIVMTPVPPQM